MEIFSRDEICGEDNWHCYNINFHEKHGPYAGGYGDGGDGRGIYGDGAFGDGNGDGNGDGDNSFHCGGHYEQTI